MQDGHGNDCHVIARCGNVAVCISKASVEFAAEGELIEDRVLLIRQ